MNLPTLFEFHADPHWRCAVVAHRGMWRRNAENTVASVEDAITDGITFVEIDVRKSRDGELVCFHDATLDRMTQRSGSVEEDDWDHLSRIPLRRADGGIAHAFSSHRIPLLRDVLRCARDRIYIDLDIKVDSLLEATVAAIADQDMLGQVNMKIEIHKPEDLGRCANLTEETALLFKPVVEINSANLHSMAEALARHDFPVVEALFESWEQMEAFMPRMRSRGTDVFLNSLDGIEGNVAKDRDAIRHPDAVWGRAIDLGVRLIQTDYPEALGAYVTHGLVDAKR